MEISTICVSILLVIATAGDDNYPGDVQKLIDGIIEANDPSQRLNPKTGYAALFKKVGDAGLRKLKLHGDDSIALQAAWQEVELSTPLKASPGTEIVDRKKLEDFLKFMESRCRCKSPAWWKEGMLHAVVNKRYNISVPTPNPDIYHDGIDDLKCPLDTTLTRSGNKLMLSIGNESIELPDALFRKSDSGKIIDENISASFSKKRCFVAVHSDVSHPYKLTCLDQPSGKIIWQSEVWSSWWGHATGRHRSFVTVIEHDNEIFVYGVGVGFHVEAFRAEGGGNLFRFSNSYHGKD